MRVTALGGQPTFVERHPEWRARNERARIGAQRAV
jgi:hypothetical protein